MTARRRPTIADVASAAGVSTSTASRALNDGEHVSDDVRRRVRDGVARIGYVPDLNARGLRAGRRQQVGVLVSNLRDDFYSSLATGIEAEMRSRGYNIFLAIDNADEAEELAAVDMFAALRVPGVIMTAVSASAVVRLREQGIAVVQADRVFSADGADAVVSANAPGAHAATTHLLDRGHRRVAMLIDEVNWTTGAGRLAGYREAHRDRSVPVDEELVVLVPSEPAAARVRVRELLAGDLRATAVLATNSVLAEAAFTEMQAMGMVLPGDMSLVAYDDAPWMSMVRPSVTTVSQHSHQIGRCCADLLVRRMTQSQDSAAITMSVQPSLVVRDSVQRLDDHGRHGARPRSPR